MSPAVSDNAAHCADAIIARVGRDIRLAVPIGIGKPIALLDALYRRAQADPALKLSIFSGLTLTRPKSKSLLEARFVEPFLDRTLGSYAEPLYLAAQRAGRLPENIEIHEFFLQAGVWTRNESVQQAYTSLAYAHVAQHLQRLGTNVFAQSVAAAPDGAARVSLSANTDVALDMLDYIAARRDAGHPTVVACEIHPQLPYMRGPAEQSLDAFDVCLRPTAPADLFSVPKQPVTLQDYAMALHTATLVKDGGMLQMGIGTFSDALSHALILRHRHNDTFRSMLASLGRPLHPEAETTPFMQGLYGCTELLVDGYLALLRAGILMRDTDDGGGHRSVLDAGFFLGNRDFYRALATLPASDAARITMRGISFTNTLRGDVKVKRLARQDARFVNSAMVVTLLGAVSSDATADGHVVSGVGGQLDLVLQAHELPVARSIIALAASRRSPFKALSNIVWTYANCTVPRSLRDIVVSEYGIADLRGKSDRACVVAMLDIADSAFQSGLAAQAKRAGKLEAGYRPVAQTNTSDRLERSLARSRQNGALPLFPHGTEMTLLEQTLVEPLSDLRSLTPRTLGRIVKAGFGATTQEEQLALTRLGLDSPTGFKERALRHLLLGALRRRAHVPVA